MRKPKPRQTKPTTIGLSETEAEALSRLSNRSQTSRLALADVVLQEEQLRHRRLQLLQEATGAQAELEQRLRTKVEMAGHDPAQSFDYDLAARTITLT